LEERKGLLDLLDELFSQTQVIMINGVKYALKKYDRTPGLLKWFIIKSASLPVTIYPFTFIPRERLERESIFLRELCRKLPVPRPILVDWGGIKLIREFIEGKKFVPGLEKDKYKDVAWAIRSIHDYGYALGDTKFQNFIISGNRIYIIDAEQAIKSRNRIHHAWDLFIFLVTTTIRLVTDNPFLDINIYTDIIKSIIDYYLAGDHDLWEEMKIIYNRKIFSGLAGVLVPLPYNFRLLKILRGR